MWVDLIWQIIRINRFTRSILVLDKRLIARQCFDVFNPLIVVLEIIHQLAPLPQQGGQDCRRPIQKRP